MARRRLPVGAPLVAVAGAAVRALHPGRLVLPQLGPQLGIVVWFLAIPFGMFLNRYRPKGAERYLT